MKKRSGFAVMARLIGLVKPLSGYMSLAVLMGLVGHLCAAFITIFGGYGVLAALRFEVPFTLTTVFISVLVFALLRGFLRYAEQACNHFIAFKLLALLRDRVFRALRKLCPAKLEGRDKGDLISVITSDIELLEVFYAHTISPAAIALLFTIVMCLFIGSFHWILGVIALAAYLIVGIVIPIVISRCSGDDGLRFRTRSGELSGFVLDSLRGLSEILQYGQGKKRLSKMNEKTDELSRDEEKMKRTAGRNTAVTNTVVLTFDLIMLFASALLYQSGAVDFDGVLIPTLALFSSFGPVIALAALGSTLQNTFAAGNRVLDILDETPVVEDVVGKPAHLRQFMLNKIDEFLVGVKLYGLNLYVHNLSSLLFYVIGPWMGLVIHLFELFDTVVGIDLCGTQRGVSQQLLDHPDIGTAVQQMGSKRMSQHVGATLSLDTGSPQHRMHHPVHLAAADPSALLR